MGWGPQWMGLGPQRGLVGPQVPVDPHSRPIPKTEETMRGMAPGPPSRRHDTWSSLWKAAPLTWIRPPCSACLSSWAAAGRPGGLVERAAGHRHHTFGRLVSSESIESGFFHSTEMSPSSTDQMQTS